MSIATSNNTKNTLKQFKTSQRYKQKSWSVRKVASCPYWWFNRYRICFT